MMKTILNTLLIGLLFSVLVACGGSESSGGSAIIDADDKSDNVDKENFSETEVFYVLATNGLRMREAPDLDSKKMEVVPYGTQVQVNPLDAKSIKAVNGLEGEMVKVFHGKDQGYMFNGYLSSIPVPQKGQDMEEYAKYLKRKSVDASYETTMADDEMSSEEILKIPAKSFQEALLIGQRVHYMIGFDIDIPTKNAKTMSFTLDKKSYSAKKMKGIEKSKPSGTTGGTDDEYDDFYQGDIAYTTDLTGAS